MKALIFLSLVFLAACDPYPSVSRVGRPTGAAGGISGSPAAGSGGGPTEEGSAGSAVGSGGDTGVPSGVPSVLLPEIHSDVHLNAVGSAFSTSSGRFKNFGGLSFSQSAATGSIHRLRNRSVGGH